jgi:16S rRNA (cytidine1402-2'-O)-methyltransferase
MSTKEFAFLGFLPVNKKQRKEKLEENRNETKTLIIYEAPHKINSTLKDLLDVLGDRKIVLAREMTKIHEEIIRDKISAVIEKQAENPKGEFVIIIEGSQQTEKENEILKRNDLSLEEHYKFYENMNLDKKEIIKRISKDRQIHKNEIYQYFLNKSKN